MTIGWFEYTGKRNKRWYDIMLKNGLVVEHCYPNADTWFGPKGQCHHDSDVARIRPSNKEM
jgi:hypothetical protein